MLLPLPVPPNNIDDPAYLAKFRAYYLEELIELVTDPRYGASTVEIEAVRRFADGGRLRIWPIAFADRLARCCQDVRLDYHVFNRLIRLWVTEYSCLQ